MSTVARALALALAGLLCACGRHGASDHQDEHGHTHAASNEPEPIAITRWTDRYELFVELPPPAPGKPVAFHAHLTWLQGFAAATEGRFSVRFKSEGRVAAEASADRVKRPGIFTPELTAPPAGRYALEMALEHAGETDLFDCGEVTVTDEPPKAEAASGAGLSFLKESQWKIPFATARAERRQIAREIELPAVVEPAGGDQLTVGAPTGGRFFHNPKHSVAEGSPVAKGDVVGFVVPSVAGDDYSRLQLSADEARIEKERTERELARVRPLVKDGLLPERRLTELESELQTHDARVRSARNRLGRVTAPGGAGGLPIRSTQAGVISQVLVPNGEPVEAGAPLLRIGGTDHIWIRARFVARPPSTLQPARAVAVRLPSGQRVELGEGRARLLSSLPTVDATSRVATWIVDVVPEPAKSREQSGSRELAAGTSVVLALQVGTPHGSLAVERSAVVEINTKPFVFVQTEGETFEKRPVVVGGSSAGFVEIESGLAAGDRIVTQGGFDIHLASLMGTVESHRH